MKNLILLSLMGLVFGFSQNVFAQTCNDPNAHNTGEMAPCETCFDGILNGDELEVDCGGTNPSCPPCDFERRLDVVGDGRIIGKLELGGAARQETLLTRAGNINGVSDAFNIRFDDDFGGSGADYLIFEKTDGNGNNPDGGIVFLNTGNDGIEEPSLLIDGNSKITLKNNIPLPSNNTDNSSFNYNTRFDYKITSSNNGLFFSVSNIGNDRRAYIQAGHESTAFSSAVGEIVLNPFGGDVGIGDTTPDYTLEVDGSAGKPGGGSWSNSSDRRLKQDIEDYEDGLEEILQIRPVWYRYNGKFGLPTEERYVGIIAQEMQEVAPYTITPYIETDDKTGESGEYLSYNGTAVTYMLVNAVQEQQEIIEEKDEKIKELEDRLTKIEAALFGKGNQELNNTTTTLTDATLFPNQPNPFSEQTLIRYYIPQGSTKAEMRITNLEGKVIKTVAIQENGEGQLTVNAHSLSAGTYLYSLLVNGELIATEKMILTTTK